MTYLLVTAANWSGRPEFVTSLPSWSCGFDSRRPLRGPATAASNKVADGRYRSAGTFSTEDCALAVAE